MQFNNQRKGFSLVEILTVVAVIGILATIITVNFMGAKAKSRDSKRIADLQNVQAAILLLKDENNGNLPVSLARCTFPGVDCLTDLETQNVLNPLPVNPTPNAGSDYQYQSFDATPDYAVLGVQLEKYSGAGASESYRGGTDWCQTGDNNWYCLQVK